MTLALGTPSRLDAILARAAQSAPEREAVVFETVRWSYRTVHDRARRLAGLLAGFGIGKGDRVGLWATNRAEFLEVFFGVPMAGAIVAPVDYWWGWADARAALGQIRARVLIVGPGQATALAGAAAELSEAGVERVLCLEAPPAGSGWLPYQELLAAAPALAEPVPVAPADPALILFTSGSTGRSKGAVHTHGGLVATALIMCLELNLGEHERTLHFLPLFSSCLEHLLPFTLARATHVVMPNFDARRVWEVARETAVTHFDAVPTTLRRLLEAAPAEIPAALRMISYASERMPDSLITALIDRMPAVRFVQFYGMIEHLCITVMEHGDQLRKIGTVGRLMMGAEIHLVPSDGAADREGVGEIVAKSPTLFAGYWGDDAATATVMRDGWMRTGDLGSIDPDGFLRLEGRLKELIKTGGLTVIPAEVEGALIAHPEVRDAAVVGLPDPEWGEAVHAFVILIPGATAGEADLKAFCHERLPGYKRPKVIHVVPELPRTGIGKIARRVVRDRVIAAQQKA